MTDTSSRQVAWWPVHQFIAAVLAQAHAGLLPMAGTPAWCALADGDPAKLLALAAAGEHHVLRMETAQEACAEASKAIAAAAPWTQIARELHQRASSRTTGAYIPPKEDSLTDNVIDESTHGVVLTEPGDAACVADGADTGSSGSDLLDDVLATLMRYVVFPDSHAAVGVVLWVIATHAVAAFQHAPRLVINSPEKRCGKSRLLDVIAGTCHQPLMSVNATVAAIYRSIGNQHPPTLLVDEADTLFGSKKVAEQNEDLRALLNAGHQRGRPALRCVGPNQVPTEFPTFAMAALAGIGAMPDTITDRAVNVTLRRRRQGERVAQFRSRRDGPVLAALRDRIAAWCATQLDVLADAEPEMPVEDRAADTWEPLIAVADAAGGRWPELARTACAVLVARADGDDEDRSLGMRLLADIRDVFTECGAAFLSSADLVVALRRIDESPWDGFDLNPSKLAYRLREYGVKPGRIGHDAIRGYTLESFYDVFGRYLRQQPSALVASQVTGGIGADGLVGADDPTRQRDSARQREAAGQGVLLTTLTGADGGSEENCSQSAGCPCGTELVSAKSVASGRCAECRLIGDELESA